MPSRRSFLSLATAAAAWRGSLASAQEHFAPFVGRDAEEVARTVEFAADIS